MKIESTLNHRARRICDFLSSIQDELCIERTELPSGATICDYGVSAKGGLRAGIHLAEICLTGLADVKMNPGRFGQDVTVYTDHPIAACLASQYAGWQVTGENFFGMGSGPMRAARSREAIFDDIGFAETAHEVVGVLESSKLPTVEVCQQLAEECKVRAADLTLCVAPTASIAGTVQVVARSLETALHKIHELGFDLSQVRSGFGSAPLPPVAADDLIGIGRTNDAVLYGGEVTIWLEGSDAELEALAEKIPSRSSRDYGTPFQEIFERYEGDFYKIDPMLFSPARVTLNNLTTGRTYRAGECRDDILEHSFFNA